MKFFAVLPASLALIAAAPAPFPSEPYAQLRQIVAPVSGAELKKMIADNPQAIGYIDPKLVDSSVRVLALR